MEVKEERDSTSSNKRYWSDFTQDGNQLNSILKPKSVEQQGNDRKQSHPECRIGIVESLLKNIPLPGYLTEDNKKDPGLSALKLTLELFQEIRKKVHPDTVHRALQEQLIQC
ncbi:hypothetical protein HZH66_013690 [Vespula vulgaris]|uniref:Uncharacterized protein n=1 Tax=Vespula vulgaris TaxID=7454 RepID=A0A834J5F1_VESVU|nr:hypothetical protein HZH66_013690 [Vespula vulgaris]